MSQILTKNGKILTVDGKAITGKSVKTNGGVVGGIIPTGTKSIVKNGKYDVYNYAEVEVNVQTSGSGSVPLFAPQLEGTNTNVTIKDSDNGSFVESYVTTVNDIVIQDNANKNVPLTSFFINNDTFTTRTYAKGLLPDSSYSNEVKHYAAKFYNENVLLDEQVVLEGNRATYPTVIPTKEGYDFLGYALDKNSTERAKLEIYNPTSFYAIFGQQLADTIIVKNYLIKHFPLPLVYDDKIYLFGGSLSDTSSFGEKKVLVYDPKTEEIVTKSGAIKTTSSFDYTGVIYRDKAYFCANGSYLYSYDFKNDTSEEISLSLRPKAMFVYKDNLYFCVSQKIYKFNVETKTSEETDWTPDASTYSNFVLYDDELYFIAELGYLSSYNLITKKTTRFFDLDNFGNGVRHAFGTAIKQGKLYLFGGQQNNSNLYTKGILSFDLITHEAKVMEAVLEEESRVYATTYNDEIYIFSSTCVMKYV